MRAFLTRFMAATVVAALTLAIAGAAPASATGRSAAVRGDDPFYRAPSDLSPFRPGDVIKYRPVSLALFGIFKERVHAWQILYRTTDAQGQPSATVTTVAKPDADYAGPRPLVSYQMPEDSVDGDCAPSRTLLPGAPAATILSQIDTLLLNGLLTEGWAVSVPDFEGPTSTFFAGYAEGRATLDGIRAAERLPALGLSADTPVGMWGYSGGASGTTWAAQLQPSYAPELRMKGAAAGGVPVDVADVANNINRGPYSGFTMAGIVGLSRAYPELQELVDRIISAKGRQLRDHFEHNCLALTALAGAFGDYNDYFTVPDPLHLPLAKKILELNRLGAYTPTAPLYIYEATHDEFMPLKDVDDLVKSWCARGASISYTRDQFLAPLISHVSVGGTGLPAALVWLRDRFAGKAQTGCATRTVSTSLLLPEVPATIVKYFFGLKALLGLRRGQVRAG